MKKICLIIMTFILFSCEDIIHSEENIKMELLIRKEKALDSLKSIELNSADFGNVKVRSVTSVQLFASNSTTKDIKIYSIELKANTGLFQIIEQLPLPYFLSNNSTAIPPQLCRIKFVANVISPGVYRDTLILNNCDDYIIPIKANVIYN